MAANGSISVVKSGMTAVLFNEPICLSLSPPEPEGRPTYPEHAQIQSILSELRAEGYDTRAVVVLGDRYEMYYEEPKNWGFVVDMRTWHRQTDPKPYKPIGVKWLSGAETTYYWPEELKLIHPAVSAKIVRLLLSGNS